MSENHDNQESEVLKHLLTGLLVFFGAFAAFYVVTDIRLHAMFNPENQIRQIEKQFVKERKSFDKKVRKNFESAEDFIGQIGGAQIIHLVQTDDNYRIIVDLSAFNNDEKNIEVRTNGRVLTILGAGIKEKKNTTNIAKFTQSYMFGDDVDLDNMTKMRDGDKYIITIPMAD